ncbi:hypothetical protein [Corynebacterium ulcerans]|uniref:hypothetical protein n=1 Tax=Corynebacterium ulcerans TaxID=65058 RepID=UPI0005FEA790|nr:hypothetical protein [Corynebacterium ulcerans]AKA97501.1 Hypothetical protein CUL131002_1999c [Corynebacterium ulcerans]
MGFRRRYYIIYLSLIVAMVFFLWDISAALEENDNVHAAGSVVIEIILLLNLSIFVSRGQWVRDVDRGGYSIVPASEAFAPERLFLLGLVILLAVLFVSTGFSVYGKDGFDELFDEAFSIAPVKWAVTLTVTVPLYEVFSRGWGELKAKQGDKVVSCKPFINSKARLRNLLYKK